MKQPVCVQLAPTADPEPAHQLLPHWVIFKLIIFIFTSWKKCIFLPLPGRKGHHRKVHNWHCCLCPCLEYQIIENYKFCIVWWYKYHLEGKTVQDWFISGGKDKLKWVRSPSSCSNPSCTYTPSVASPTLYKEFSTSLSHIGIKLWFPTLWRLRMGWQWRDISHWDSSWQG